MVHHLVLWLLIINGFVGLIGWAEGHDGEAASEVYGDAVQVFFIIGGIAAALGVVSTTQGAIVGEKQLGTGAWGFLSNFLTKSVWFASSSFKTKQAASLRMRPSDSDDIKEGEGAA